MSLFGVMRDAMARGRQGNLGTVVVNQLRERRNQARRLLPHAAPINGRASSRRVNRLVAELGATRYLEIGVHKGVTLETVTAPERTAVEPVPMFDTGHLPAGVQVYCGTSDDFFASIGAEAVFDLVFVDGLHVFEQAYRDVINSFRTSPRPGSFSSMTSYPTTRSRRCATSMSRHGAGRAGPCGARLER